jgi:putative ABC transport system permease protein
MNYMTIVGVVGDVRQDSPASSPGPELYMPLAQHPFYANEVQVVLRTTVQPAALTEAVRTTVEEISPSMATKFTTMDAMVSDSIATPRFRTYLAGIFAGLAMLLATSGIYGLMSYMAAQRTSEFGLRMALGAQPIDVMRLILRQTLGLTGIGIAAGIAASLLSTRVLSSILFEIHTLDPVTYVAVLAAILVVALTAAAVPAWRATRVDPVQALRQE